MAFECPLKFTEEDLDIYLPLEIKEKFLKFRTKYKINENPDLKWCPNNTCDNFINIKTANKKKDFIICDKC